MYTETVAAICCVVAKGLRIESRSGLALIFTPKPLVIVQRDWTTMKECQNLKCKPSPIAMLQF